HAFFMDVSAAPTLIPDVQLLALLWDSDCCWLVGRDRRAVRKQHARSYACGDAHELATISVPGRTSIRQRARVRHTHCARSPHVGLAGSLAHFHHLLCLAETWGFVGFQPPIIGGTLNERGRAMLYCYVRNEWLRAECQTACAAQRGGT